MTSATPSRPPASEPAPSARQALIVVAYHYVRDLPRTRFPRIAGLPIERFREQLVYVRSRFEMATLESALEFLHGRYQPPRELCLLTFDDGLKEHYTEVLPLLRAAGMQGCFFPATLGLHGGVATVHKIHFLMASMAFAEYRRSFLDELARLSPGRVWDTPEAAVSQAYPWDRPEVGALKYLANFVVPPAVRDRVIDALFAAHLGDDGPFARELYLSWEELREMQAEGMIIGGHSHRHDALPGLSAEAQEADLRASAAELTARLRPQDQWPFAYPYGRFNDVTVDILRRLNFSCAFTVESGSNPATHDVFRLRRVDTNQLLPV